MGIATFAMGLVRKPEENASNTRTKHNVVVPAKTSMRRALADIIPHSGVPEISLLLGACGIILQI